LAGYVGLPENDFLKEIVGASRREQIGSVKDKYRFYEKVLNVKADVAAILNSFFPSAVVSDPAICSRQRPFHRCHGSRGLRMR
jgi:hypothetical protein